MKLGPNVFRFALPGLLICALVPSTPAAPKSSARVTRVIRDVKILPQQAAPRPASESDSVSSGTAIRTGTESRAELTFTDETVARLGANSIFSFNEGSRQVDLGGGAILVEVPRNGEQAKVVTASVTAAITGGTALLETHKKSGTKLVVLEGIGRFYRNGHPEDAVIVHGGEMVVMTAEGRMSRPTKINAKLLFATAKLITDFSPLANADLIMAVIAEQQAGQSATSTSAQPNDTTSIVDQRTNSIPPAGAPAGPGKFGSPKVIPGNPYVITSQTLITTDPKITTNNITDRGKIYRGPIDDGPFLEYLGLTPTAFDIASGEPNPKNALPFPVFLFENLRLDGDPMISTANGGTPHLGLGSMAGISFSPTGLVYSFGGLSNVGIVALGGDLNATGVAFANFGDLFLEARGAGSTLTLGSPVNNLQNLDLVAEGTVQVSSTVALSDEFKAFSGSQTVISSTVKANRIKVESLGGIQLTNSSQLLALVNSTGSSGQVLLADSGNDTTIGVGGMVKADQGEVDIRQTGRNGVVTINTATIRGDVVKVSALGMNGVINVGAGNTLGADTVLKLYATGSNGTLNFKSNVTLNGPTVVLAANAINITQGVVVTINSPGAPAADVFTNNANYTGFGGTAPAGTAGTFGGAGAKNPLPLANAPPLGGPGSGP